MPPLTRWFIKTSLLWFVAGLLAFAVAPWVAVLGPPPVAIHLLVVGWITQMIFGVAYWMFPKWTNEQPRGNIPLGIATYVALNLGLLLRGLGEPLQTLSPGGGWGWTLAVSAVLQWIAGMAFVINTWPRVKAR